MYQAELRGKLSSRIERMEDILTSNVFSFFKYATREIFLRGYLGVLGFAVSDQEASEADFIFWPRFEENTEPDLVIIAGDYYLLIEAKYFSEFGGESEKTEAQLIRELNGGKLDAKNYNKTFKLIAITADHYYKENKFDIIPSEFRAHFKWTNWQSVAAFLNNILQTRADIRPQEHVFALDLFSLLDKKSLRGFQSLDILQDTIPHLKPYDSLFFEAKSAKFRGAFIGFRETLLFDKKIALMKGTIFLSGERRFFNHMFQSSSLKQAENVIFFTGKDHERQKRTD